MLEDHRVGSLADVYYVANYLSAADEQTFLKQIVSSKAKWTQVSGRRLINYGGQIHEQKQVLLQAPMPSWLRPLLERLARDAEAFGAGPEAPNHVLLNAYLPGQGILAHQDGPLYHPVVCIVSLGAPAVIRFTRKRSIEGAAGSSEPVLSVALLPRSLLVFSGEAYEQCLHGIEEVEVERLDESVVNWAALPPSLGRTLPRGGERFSLTVRRVLHARNLFRVQT